MVSALEVAGVKPVIDKVGPRRKTAIARADL